MKKFDDVGGVKKKIMLSSFQLRTELLSSSIRLTETAYFFFFVNFHQLDSIEGSVYINSSVEN